MSSKRQSYYPTEASFSRGQLQLRTGIPDDVLAFWIKQNLIRPLPAERRAHRRFSYEQIHIAVILNAMRTLGANVGVLRLFSDAIQNGFKLWKASDFDYQQIRVATWLARMLDDFRSGKEVEVIKQQSNFDQPQLAETEDDVVQGWLFRERKEGADASLVPFARSLSRYESECIGWAHELVDPSHLIHATTGSGNAWVAWIDREGLARFADDNAVVLEREEGPDAAFYIPLVRLIQRVWNDRIDQARQRYAIERQRVLLEHMHRLERDNPAQAEETRLRWGWPENWSDLETVAEGKAET